MIAVALSGVAFVVCLIGLMVTVNAAVPPWLFWSVGCVITLVAFWRLVLEEIQRRADERSIAADRERFARPEPFRQPGGNTGRLPE